MIDDIMAEKERLDRLLQLAVATMERKETLNEIRAQMRVNQARCPHFSHKYNYTWVGDTCPYCGKTNCIKPKEE